MCWQEIIWELFFLRIQWRLIFAVVIRCYRLWLWVGYFIYFKTTPVFFSWMFFNSIKEIIRLRKEISRLLSKEMWNIYLKVTIATFSKLRFSGFRKFVTRPIFGELQLTQKSLNFETSCCKIRGLGTKLRATFLLF